MAKRADIQADIDLDSSGFRKGITKAQSKVKQFTGSAMRSFGALAGAAGFGALANSAINLGSKISDMAVQMNIGTDQLQTLEFAAREAGVGVEVMARALRNVQLRTEEAIKGNKSYGDAFKALGINVNEFKKLSVEKRMEAIAIAQSDATDSGAAYNAVSRILGEKAGPALQEVLQNLAGKEGYGGLEAAAKRAGEVMSKETIAKTDAAADRIESFKRRITVLTGEILAKAMPAFKILGDGLGFVGEVIGVTLLNWKAFTSFMVSSVSQIIQPLLLNFKALGKGIEATMLAGTGNFKEAKAAMKEAGSLGEEAFNELVNIPSDIAEEFSKATKDVQFNMSSLDGDLETRADSITKSWDEITGAVKKFVKEIQEAKKKINDPPPKVLESSEEKIKRLKLELLEAEVAGKQRLVEEINKQLLAETSIAKIMSDTGVTREEAVKIEASLTKVKGFQLETEQHLTSESAKQLGIAEAQRKTELHVARALGAQLNYRKQMAEGAAKQLGINTDVESKSTEELKADLIFRQKQKREVDLEKRKAGAFGGIAESFDQAALMTQIRRITEELAKRSDVQTLSGFGAQGLFERGYSQEEVDRLMQANQQDFSELESGRALQSRDEQTDLLRRLEDGISSIERNVSSLGTAIR